MAMTISERKRLKRAEAYWNYQRERVLLIAAQHDIEIEIAEHDDPFLFDLFDGGDADLTDDEIISELEAVA